MELIESLVQDRGGQLNTIEVGDPSFRLRKQVSPPTRKGAKGRESSVTQFNLT
mgnify:CR=1 FL=1